MTLHILLREILHRSLDGVQATLHALGWRLTRARVTRMFSRIPEAQYYAEVFEPWRRSEFVTLYERIKPQTLVSADRCYVLHALAKQALHLEGEYWECGVYRGGTAMLLREVTSANGRSLRTLRLFDTFSGMPPTRPEKDVHREGDFSDTSPEQIRHLLGDNDDHTSLHPGRIPASFRGLEDRDVAFAHVDVDIFDSVIECCTFIYPRLVTGGVIVFDDYGFPSCPGAREAVDLFFADKPEVPIVLPTGQAIIFRLPRGERDKLQSKGS